MTDRKEYIKIQRLEHQGFRKEPFQVSEYTLVQGVNNINQLTVEEEHTTGEVVITVEDSENLGYMVIKDKSCFKQFVTLLHDRFILGLEVNPEDERDYNG